MTPDQRLIGMDLIELRALAFGGNPAEAEQVGHRLSRAAATLEQVSASLERAAGQVGLSWRGQAADAARTGIAEHAQWARNAAARTATAGGNATAQADSANYVRANMPDPGIRSAALGPGGGPVGTNPVGTNIAQAEEAQRNAQLRAVELLEGHASKSAAQRPTGALDAPPGGAAAAGHGGPTRTVGGPGRIGGPGTAAEGSRARRSYPGGRPGYTPGTPAGGTRGGPDRRALSGATASTPARGGAPQAGGIPATSGTNAGHGARSPRGTTGYGAVGPVDVEGTAPGMIAAAPADPESAIAGRRRALPRGSGTEPAAAGTGHDRPGAHGPGSRGDRTPPLPARVGARAGVGAGAGAGLPTEQQASQSGSGAAGPHRPREGGDSAGGLAPPIGGAGVGAPSTAPHQRLGFLIDEDCAFDFDHDGDPGGHDLHNGGWVSPPVIGA